MRAETWQFPPRTFRPKYAGAARGKDAAPCGGWIRPGFTVEFLLPTTGRPAEIAVAWAATRALQAQLGVTATDSAT
jgi:hypothetical protein